MEQSTCKVTKVCVTGGSGYIGSSLVKKLLEKGYVVHATLRNLDDVSKVSLLKSLPGAGTRLVLFKADINNPAEFESAIQGCEFVFHVAHQTTEFQNVVESAVAGAKSIATSCVKSGTVKRLIYTASIVSASSLDSDGKGFKDFVDETCWTPLNLQVPYANQFLQTYSDSKTLSEKEILKFGKENGGELEVVTLGCGLVGGESLSPLPGSVSVIVSQLTGNEHSYSALMYIHELLGKVPLVHIEDTCDAHIFCMENPSLHGRVLLASSFVSSSEIARYFRQNYPRFPLKEEYLNGPNKEIEWTSSKLKDMGFVFKFDFKKILDDSVECAEKMGYL